MKSQVIYYAFHLLSLLLRVLSFIAMSITFASIFLLFNKTDLFCNVDFSMSVCCPYYMCKFVLKVD